jgi:hypothetical protein
MHTQLNYVKALTNRQDRLITHLNKFSWTIIGIRNMIRPALIITLEEQEIQIS